MDIIAAICDQTHSGNICVTASINHVDFNSAANVGDIILIYAKMTRAFNTSMEILVQAYARKVLVEKKCLTSEAYFTFVALDEKGKATQVVALEPLTTIRCGIQKEETKVRQKGKG